MAKRQSIQLVGGRPKKGTSASELPRSEKAVLTIIRKNLRHHIRESEFDSVEAFAYANDIPKSTLSRILNDRREPQVSTLVKISNALGVVVTSFFSVPNPCPEDWNDL